MLCGIGHGASVGERARRSYLVDRESCGRFGYFFPCADPAPKDKDMAARLDALADAMSDTPQDPDNDGAIPPVFTYLGQFIDHDITAGTDREIGDSRIDAETVEPLSRDEVMSDLMNLRTGQLDLDSLYGDKSVIRAASRADQEFLEDLADLLRFPGDRAKMWIAFYSNPEGGVPDPEDRAGDLLRLGRLLSPSDPKISRKRLDALSDDLKGAFLEDNGEPQIHRAIIGDGRNDENLIVAQVHLAFLRFHNRVVDSCADPAVLAGGREAVFRWARREVRRVYQWLVANVYLPTICNADTLGHTLGAGAPAYRDFLAANPPCGDGRLPLPLEFSVAAFRFGHSMVRSEYDWNRFFGRAADGAPNSTATFQQMFAFTGGGRMDGGRATRLPSVWGAEWSRMTEGPSDAFPDRAARKIDTLLSPPLDQLPLDGDVQFPGVMRHLARRNLRRGHVLNLPSAQDCVAMLNRNYGYDIRPLTKKELTSGPTGKAVKAGGFDDATPIWFYALKEAEAREDGARLGPLGSALVAETLLGLIMNDAGSYWNAPGSDRGRWWPMDGPRPAGEPVMSVEALLRAAGSL